MADLQGKCIKEYAMQELEAFLKPRIEAAEGGQVVSASVYSIFEETLAKSGS